MYHWQQDAFCQAMILPNSYSIERKGLDHVCEGCIVAPINQQSGNREGDQDD